MPRYKLTLAYDGAAFHGWQKQEPLADAPTGIPHPAETEELPDKPGRVALRTVQHVVERAVREAVREPIILTGASRTDAGVHALGQVAAFTSHPDPDKGVGWPEERGTDTLVRAVNAKLPPDVLVRAAEAVPDTFDPISDCVSKGYAYTIHAADNRPLWDRGRVFHTWHDLDLDTMRAAAAHLVGEHDFAGFAAANHGRQTTVRTIFDCNVTELPAGDDQPLHRPGGGGGPRSGSEGVSSMPPRRYRLDVSGNGFLYNMVRIIAGTLHEAGRGRLDPNRVPEILESKDRTQAGPTLPPEGLRLEWIRYA